MVKNMPGRAAEHDFSHPRPAVGAHDQQVGAKAVDLREERDASVMVMGVSGYRQHFCGNTVPLEVASDQIGGAASVAGGEDDTDTIGVGQ